MTRHMMASAVVSAPSRSDWIGAEDQGGVSEYHHHRRPTSHAKRIRWYVQRLCSIYPTARTRTHSFSASQPLDFAVLTKEAKKLCSGTRLSGPVELTTVGVDLPRGSTQHRHNHPVRPFDTSNPPISSQPRILAPDCHRARTHTPQH